MTTMTGINFTENFGAIIAETAVENCTVFLCSSDENRQDFRIVIPDIEYKKEKTKIDAGNVIKTLRGRLRDVLSEIKSGLALEEGGSITKDQDLKCYTLSIIDQDRKAALTAAAAADRENKAVMVFNAVCQNTLNSSVVAPKQAERINKEIFGEEAILKRPNRPAVEKKSTRSAFPEITIGNHRFTSGHTYRINTTIALSETLPLAEYAEEIPRHLQLPGYMKFHSSQVNQTKGGITIAIDVSVTKDDHARIVDAKKQWQQQIIDACRQAHYEAVKKQNSSPKNPNHRGR